MPDEDNIAGRTRQKSQDAGEMMLSSATTNKARDQLGGQHDDRDYCRICRGEGNEELPLFYPCKCSGSIRYVHQDCLMEWLSHSQKKYCELCKATFRFTKLYDHNMPQTLPMSIFIRQLCLRAVYRLFRWLRYMLVCLVWLVFLPYSIRQVWRLLFWVADGSWGSLNEPSPNSPATTANAAENLNSRHLPLEEMPAFQKILPQTAGLLLEFAEPASSDLLIAKLFRLLRANLHKWFTGMNAIRSYHGTLLPGWARESSLLSEVHYLKYLTPYKFCNDSVMDVLEGQVICLMIVTGFVLVFLIREWVINQQVVPFVHGNNNRQPAPPAVEVPGAGRDPGRGNQARPIINQDSGEDTHRKAQPRDHLRHVHSTPTVEDSGGDEPESADRKRYLEHEAAEERLDDDTLSVEPMDDQYVAFQKEGHKDAMEGPQSNRPPFPCRRDSEDVAGVRRAVEGGALSQPRVAGSETNVLNELWEKSGHDPEEVLRLIHEEQREDELEWIVSHMERLQQQRRQQIVHRSIDQAGREAAGATDAYTPVSIGPTWQSSREKAVISPSAAQSLGSMPSIEAGLIPAMEFNGEVPHLKESKQTLSSSTPTDFFTPETSDASTDQASFEPESSSSQAGPEQLRMRNEDSPDVVADVDPKSDRSTVDVIAEWFWRTDDCNPPHAGLLDEADSHRLQVERTDQQSRAEVAAPHTMASNAEPEVREQEPANVDAAAPAGEHELRAAGMAAGLDLDAEAMEEVEDLDGLLELIGMRGPLSAMVQNVVFSQALITLVLSISVWLPYIWGKIALLLAVNVGVFAQLPFSLLSRMADTVLDLCLFLSGTTLYTLGYLVDQSAPYVGSIYPSWQAWVESNTLRKLALDLASASGTRLESEFYVTVSGLRPDLPLFSMVSHHALRELQQASSDMAEAFATFVKQVIAIRLPSTLPLRGFASYASKSYVQEALKNAGYPFPQLMYRCCRLMRQLPRLRFLRPRPMSFIDISSLDHSLVQWGIQDRVITVALGYAFLTLLGYLYIRMNRLLRGLDKTEKVDGVVADILNQAGGVLKVITIIGIEMIAFPLYCGLLLDIALLPLFDGADLHARIDFLRDAPATAFFIHWFVGTGYMFHFALFVSMCRKILRKGVLYFIRDPDDPTFHPVRDVLERPVASQLRKIAFSAMVYGGLIILCLGAVIGTISPIRGIFPIYWTSHEPILELPIDLLFYNVLLPIVIRRSDPAKKLRATYEWCFRKCARSLRLTHFLFNEEKSDECGRYVEVTWKNKLCRWTRVLTSLFVDEAHRQTPNHEAQLGPYFQPNGSFVLAPAADSVRIPQGGQVFRAVEEKDNNADGQPADNEGSNATKNEDFIMVYIPPMFRARIILFVLQIWTFTAVSGVVLTIVPLVIGRRTIDLFSQSKQPSNDLYAFTFGIFLCGVAIYFYSACQIWTRRIVGLVQQRPKFGTEVFIRLWQGLIHICGLVYMTIMLSIVLPMLLALSVELYVINPLNTYLASIYAGDHTSRPLAALQPTIYITQTWIIGLIYSRLILFFITHSLNRERRIVTAVSRVLRDGVRRPNVKLTSRAIILPFVLLFSVLLLTPFGFAWVVSSALGEHHHCGNLYRHSYPGFLLVATVGYFAVLLQREVGRWRINIRDDFYLIGQRLHNCGRTSSQNGDKKPKSAEESQAPVTDLDSMDRHRDAATQT